MVALNQLMKRLVTLNKSLFHQNTWSLLPGGDIEVGYRLFKFILQVLTNGE